MLWVSDRMISYLEFMLSQVSEARPGAPRLVKLQAVRYLETACNPDTMLPGADRADPQDAALTQSRGLKLHACKLLAATGATRLPEGPATTIGMTDTREAEGEKDAT
jgi:hypothetical protein